MRIIIIILASIAWFGIYALMVIWCFREIDFSFSLRLGVAIIWWIVVLCVWLGLWKIVIEDILLATELLQKRKLKLAIFEV